MNLPFLGQDIVTIKTLVQDKAMDAEGNIGGQWQVYKTIRGFVGDPVARDLDAAAQRGEILDVAIALQPQDIPPLGAQIIARGKTYVVVGIDFTRAHTRVLCRVAEPFATVVG